ncbi:MAG: glycosyl transferase family 1 [Chryseobacterium sp. 39-10]|mgnify:CR=1 FL=1|nr:glycosyltransferase [Chryseobacterium sp.]OJV48891.1 MAG: glycosyl transferase family 1 [Chryseobacterium sp. 39-10]
MAKILFLTTAHKFDDDRIFFHQAKTLQQNGFQVKICSLNSAFSGTIDGVEIDSSSILQQSAKQKIAAFQNVINAFQPDAIIASEPLAVMAAKAYRSKSKIPLMYDITEWYPSYRMLQQYKGFTKFFHAVKFFLIQGYAGFLSSHFIFGEDNKKFPLAQLFPWKKSLDLGYYPDEKYVADHVKELTPNAIRLCYTGRISEEDGIGNFFKAIAALQKKRPSLKVSVLIIGRPKRKSDEQYFSALLEEYNFSDIEIREQVPFVEFTNALASADLCFDLRENNREYSRSFPIKIFYYAGAGKPVIYTALKAIQNKMDISAFGHLVHPEDSEKIADIVLNYIDDPALYMQHAKRGRSLFLMQCNWRKISDSFVKFVKKALQ